MNKITMLSVLLLTLSGCASTYEWTPDNLEAKDIRMEFVDEDRWFELVQRTTKCEDIHFCELQARDTLGIAWFRNVETCTIYIPAFRGMPTYHTLTHEIRHCYRGSHSEWNLDK